ncbi:MAG: hypothetical protein KJ941_06320 [Bacteroidetes bacterium]|nr:hypothetical protein [Bacteroidota bacterium]
MGTNNPFLILAILGFNLTVYAQIYNGSSKISKLNNKLDSLEIALTKTPNDEMNAESFEMLRIKLDSLQYSNDLKDSLISGLRLNIQNCKNFTNITTDQLEFRGEANVKQEEFYIILASFKNETSVLIWKQQHPDKIVEVLSDKNKNWIHIVGPKKTSRSEMLTMVSEYRAGEFKDAWYVQGNYFLFE